MSAVSNRPMLELHGVGKWYDDFCALYDINLTVMPGERVVVCGPSGSGKSTMIRCVNRLEEHEVGRIMVDGTEVTENRKHIQAIRREVGMVFQPKTPRYPCARAATGIAGSSPRTPSTGDGNVPRET